MTHVGENRSIERARRQRFDKTERDARETLAGRRHAAPSVEVQGPQPELPLVQRYELREAIAYVVEAPEGEIGHVTAVKIAPFEYWPHELIVEDIAGTRMRIPINTVSAVFPREGRLFVTTAPTGARPGPRPRESGPSAWVWQFAAIAGAVFGLGGYVGTFVALALDTGASWGPGLAASGAAGGAAAAASLRNRGSSWAAALGLGSFWLPLAVGAILSLVLIFG